MKTRNGKLIIPNPPTGATGTMYARYTFAKVPAKLKYISYGVDVNGLSTYPGVALGQWIGFYHRAYKNTSFGVYSDNGYAPNANSADSVWFRDWNTGAPNDGTYRFQFESTDLSSPSPISCSRVDSGGANWTVTKMVPTARTSTAVNAPLMDSVKHFFLFSVGQGNLTT